MRSPITTIAGRAPEPPRDRCDLGKRPDLSVWHDSYLKPNLGCAPQRQRAVQFDAGCLRQIHEET